MTNNDFFPAYRFSCRGVHFRKRKKQGPALRRIRSVRVRHRRKTEKTMIFPEAERQRDKENCTDRSSRGRDSKGRARLEPFSQKQVFGKMGRQRRPLVPLSRPPLSLNGERGGKPSVSGLARSTIPQPMFKERGFFTKKRQSLFALP